MNIEKDNIYHIYNQGNNRQKIFFNRDNYLFFLKKIKTYILPYADILAWCLMPNHFHLMVLVNYEELPVVDSTTHQMTSSHQMSSKNRTFTSSIAIMLRSYTRAINKQENLSGSLFRAHTKAECITCSDGITPLFYNVNGITQINILKPAEEQYPQVCFDYIHQNPVNGKLAKSATDWEFSSAKDYAGMRNGKLINRKVAGEFVDFKND